jgi:hypothetical protein
MGALRALAAEKSRAHRSRFIGRTLLAITLNTAPSLAELGRTSALTENLLPVELEGRFPANESLTVRVTRLNASSELRACATVDRSP